MSESEDEIFSLKAQLFSAQHSSEFWKEEFESCKRQFEEYIQSIKDRDAWINQETDNGTLPLRPIQACGDIPTLKAIIRSHDKRFRKIRDIIRKPGDHEKKVLDILRIL